MQWLHTTCRIGKQIIPKQAQKYKTKRKRKRIKDVEKFECYYGDFNAKSYINRWMVGWEREREIRELFKLVLERDLRDSEKR